MGPDEAEFVHGKEMRLANIANLKPGGVDVASGAKPARGGIAIGRRVVGLHGWLLGEGCGDNKLEL